MTTLDVFLREVDEALVDPAAVREVVGQHLRGFAEYIEPPTGTHLAVLRHDAAATVLAGWWAPEFELGPHDHQLWLVAGVFAGAERNSFFRRSPSGVVAAGSRVLSSGSTLALGPAGIHAVANAGTTWAGVVQVYGGDLFATARSAFDPQTLEERPFDASL